MKRITFQISDDLDRKVKLLCYTEGISQGEMMISSVKKFCEEHDAHLIELIDNRKKNY